MMMFSAILVNAGVALQIFGSSSPSARGTQRFSGNFLFLLLVPCGRTTEVIVVSHVSTGMAWMVLGACFVFSGLSPVGVLPIGSLSFVMWFPIPDNLGGFVLTK